ncbi:hypothetical protein [Helicobacter sp. MIT 14-3879]|uniref:hypothetical protein n=1 Tax=Helicobacter sp. MIT 14-3879 TaxID=2040649 RepID=UPI000E1F96F5|nr:hypothetical protein [Helicobacter sp. MIT 14-3879]RDU62672.1 hypothetical protein CQA44_06710 [Helicobacter sp. MIT 14-3879]
MRIIKAPLKIEFSKISSELDNENYFKNEFDRLSENNDDPISLYLRNIRSRGKVIDDNEPIIQLLIELHRKVDALSLYIKKETKEYIKLDIETILDSIGHSLIIFQNDILETSQKYYARLDIAIFPARKVPIFFQALNSKEGRIYLMHNRDIVDFDGYITARERSLIRENKTKS